MALSMRDYAAQTSEPIRKGLIQRITNTSVFMKLLNFIDLKGQGMNYEYGEQATTGGIEWRSINEKYQSSTGIVNPKTEKTGIFGGVVESDQRMIDTNPDTRGNSIAAKVQRAGLFFDAAVIAGDPAVNPKSFPGLRRRIVGKQLLHCGVNGGSLTLEIADEMLDAVVGPNKEKAIVTNKIGRRKLRNLLGIKPGTPFTDYDDAQIVVIDEDGDDNPIIAYNEKWGTSEVTASMYCIRLGGTVDGEWVQGIASTKLIETYDGGRDGNMVKDVVEAQVGIAVFHGRSASRIAGILDD